MLNLGFFLRYFVNLAPGDQDDSTDAVVQANFVLMGKTVIQV